MSDEPYALSPPAAPTAPPPSEAEYDAILAAVMETVRGRWFLSEFSRRNRQTDTRLVLAAIERLEATLRGDREAPSIERIRVDIRDMARAIDLTKREIAAIKPDHDHGGRIEKATEELDSIVQTTEQATSDILAAAEQIQETAWTLREQGIDDLSCDQLDGRSTDIYLACSFQDLTGQRIRKVIHVLRYLEGRITTMMEILGAGEPEVAPAEPASAGASGGHAEHFDTTLDQAEIDEVIPATHAACTGPRDHPADLIIDHEPALLPLEAGSPKPAAPLAAGASAGPEPDGWTAPFDDLVAAHEPDVAPAWEPVDEALQEKPAETASSLPTPASAVAGSPESSFAIAANADDDPASPPRVDDEPAFEFKLLDHSAPSADIAPPGSEDAEADAWLRASGTPYAGVPPLETATFDPIAVSEPPAMPEPADDAGPAMAASDPAEDGGVPALSPEPAPADVPDRGRAENAAPGPIAIDTQALLADLLAIIRPAADQEAATASSATDEAEPAAATAHAAEHPPERDPPPGDAVTVASPVLVAPRSELPDPPDALALQTITPPAAPDSGHPTEPDSPPVEAAQIPGRSWTAPAADELAPAPDAAPAPESAHDAAPASGQVPVEHPDVVDPGLLPADFLIMPAGGAVADVTRFDWRPEAAEAPVDDAGPVDAEPAARLDADAAGDATEAGPAPTPAPAPSAEDGSPAVPDLALPEVDVVAVEADDDIFMPLAAPAVTAAVPTATARYPVEPTAFGPAAPGPQGPAPAIRFYRAPTGGLGATTIEVPLAQAASTVELPVVSPTQPAPPWRPGLSRVSSRATEAAETTDAFAVASRPPAADDVPAGPDTERSSPSPALAAPTSTPSFRPAPRPAAPLPTNDPLAAIAALGVEEKIALFS